MLPTNLRPMIVVVPGPVDSDTQVDSLQSLATYIAPHPDHPTRKFVEDVLRSYPAHVVPYILVRPEKEWFPQGQLHPAVKRFPSSPAAVAAEIRAMTDEQRSETIELLMNEFKLRPVT